MKFLRISYSESFWEEAGNWVGSTLNSWNLSNLRRVKEGVLGNGYGREGQEVEIEHYKKEL